jgi:hypothetical protein
VLLAAAAQLQLHPAWLTAPTALLPAHRQYQLHRHTKSSRDGVRNFALQRACVCCPPTVLLVLCHTLAVTRPEVEMHLTQSKTKAAAATGLHNWFTPRLPAAAGASPGFFFPAGAACFGGAAGGADAAGAAAPFAPAAAAPGFAAAALAACAVCWCVCRASTSACNKQPAAAVKEADCSQTASTGEGSRMVDVMPTNKVWAMPSQVCSILQK